MVAGDGLTQADVCLCTYGSQHAACVTVTGYPIQASLSPSFIPSLLSTPSYRAHTCLVIREGRREL